MKKKVSRIAVLKNYIVHLAIAGVLAIFALWTVINFFYQKPVHTAALIAQDIQTLSAIFNRIEKECGILSFDYQANPINFLNIKKNGFVGSEIGSMNLAHPEKWQGPYLQDNLSMQQKDYQIVRTDRGYFITPGNGVKLPNNKIIGTDIILDEKANIPAMMHDPYALMYEDKPLAAPLITERTVVGSNILNAMATEEDE